jgi:release factor glutamine methyltransferase
MISINQALSQAKIILSKTSQTPHLDAEVLLSHTLNTSREYILTYSEKILNKKQILKFNKLVTLRKKHTPIAYLINQKEFFGLNFKVNKNTLIPRPETESLVELATYNFQHVTNNKKTTSIIDIGTGSGNIIISVANYYKQPPVSNKAINYFGIDISKKALSIAEMNSRIHKFSSKIKFIKSDLLKYFLDHYSLLADNCIIIANLPYLSKAI